MLYAPHLAYDCNVRGDVFVSKKKTGPMVVNGAQDPDVQDLVDDVDYKPSTTVEAGVKNFVEWYLDYYK
jgi:nucleoside-diphosphate-sugar epimerase